MNKRRSHGPTIHFNPWWICTEVSPGCDKCYARELAARWGYDWGHGVPRRTFGEKHWNEPLKWNAKAAKAGVMAKVFCASMADIFDEEAPVGELERLWTLIDKTPNLIWQLLTKRPNGYNTKVPAVYLNHPRVWKGITVEDGERLRKRWPLVETLPGIRWISYEPALGPLPAAWHRPPNWIVFGGESGNGFRPMQGRWAYECRKMCEDFGIKFFMKQWSARTPTEGKHLIPLDLQIQEFPV